VTAGEWGQLTTCAVIAVALGWEARRRYQHWADRAWIRALRRSPHLTPDNWYPPVAAGDHEQVDGHG